MPTPLLAVLLASSAVSAQPPIHALLITGANNHNWQYTSRLHKDTLEATGRFTVDITDHPDTDLADPANLARYQLFILDYNDFNAPKRWPAAAEHAFADAVSNGAGVVAIHSADNAFRGWTDYEKMLGLVWERNKTAHGDFHPFAVTYTDHDHPITRGLADMQNHPDELYHSLINPQGVPYHRLAQAFDDTKFKGLGGNEPMAVTLTFGKGRVFATPLGHVWTNSPGSKPSISDPQFKILICRGAEWAATGNVSLGTTWADTIDHNTLTSQEQSDGWVLLFDGKTSKGWHGYKTSSFPEGWTVKDGVLSRVSGKPGADLATDGEYANFEFACDFKITPHGNSGIIYRSTEDHGACWETGPEMQVLDDAGYPDENPKNGCGSLYDLFPIALDVARPANEWQHARIIVKGAHVEHWLNGFKVVDTDTTSDDYKKALAASKWTKYPDYNSRPKGHIVFQGDHEGEVQYRAIKIRPLG